MSFVPLDNYPPFIEEVDILNVKCAPQAAVCEHLFLSYWYCWGMS